MFQRALNRCVNVLRAVPTEVALDDAVFMRSLRTSELRRNYHLVSIASLFHPFTNPLLGLIVLIIYGGVDEVAALCVKIIHHFEGCLLGTLAKDILPSITKIHSAEAEWRDADTSCRSEDAVAPQDGDRGWRWSAGHPGEI